MATLTGFTDPLGGVGRQVTVTRKQYFEPQGRLIRKDGSLHLPNDQKTRKLASSEQKMEE